VDRQRFEGILFLAAVAVLIGAWWIGPLRDWLTVAHLREAEAGLRGLVEAEPLLCFSCFFLLCLILTACCFPAAPVIGIAAGALFGFWPGLAAVLIATTIGSTAALHMSRTFLRDWVRVRLGHRMGRIDSGFAAHGPAYLLALRFNPVIPYWIVNLAMGLTGMRVATYVPLTLVGLVPATLIYVHAGTRLSAIANVADIFTPGLLATLLLLCALPLVGEVMLARRRLSSSGSAPASRRRGRGASADTCDPASARGSSESSGSNSNRLREWD